MISGLVVRLVAVRAAVLGALGVEVERVVLDGEAAFAGNEVLPALNFRVVEFLDATAINADQMVMVLAAVDLEDRLARFEEMALQQAGLFELGEHAIDGRQADIHVVVDEHPVDVFSGHVTLGAFFEKLKNLQARKGGFQAHVLETLGVAHRDDSSEGAGAGQWGISGMIYRFKAD